MEARKAPQDTKSHGGGMMSAVKLLMIREDCMVYGRSQRTEMMKRRQRKTNRLTYTKAKNDARRVIGKAKETERSRWVEELETQDAQGRESIQNGKDIGGEK